MVTVTDTFNSDRELVRQTVTFDVTNDAIAAYCRDCSLAPDLLRGEAVILAPDGPIPWAILEGIRLLSEWRPPPPCGSKQRPHLVAPLGKPGDLRRCVTCGDIGYLPDPPYVTP